MNYLPGSWSSTCSCPGFCILSSSCSHLVLPTQSADANDLFAVATNYLLVFWFLFKLKVSHKILHFNFVFFSAPVFFFANLSVCSRGCSMAEIWDIEDEVNRGKVPACERLYVEPAPFFRRVFRNEQYDVLQVIKTPSVGKASNHQRTH